MHIVVFIFYYDVFVFLLLYFSFHCIHISSLNNGNINIRNNDWGEEIWIKLKQKKVNRYNDFSESTPFLVSSILPGDLYLNTIFIFSFYFDGFFLQLHLYRRMSPNFHEKNKSIDCCKQTKFSITSTFLMSVRISCYYQRRHLLDRKISCTIAKREIVQNRQVQWNSNKVM